MPEGRGPGDPAARRALDELHAKGLNFEPERRAISRAQGWRIDDYCRTLPSEPPGPPVPGASWEIARGLMRDYEFADPAIVRAIYYPDRPLEQRDMLLEGRFFGLRFYFGCRIGGLIDETRTVEARDVRVWGWNYRTLQGHLEMGQMDYEVWKWIDSGEVEFRIHAFSKPARIPNPLVRLGFWLFGRTMQVRFAERACDRMARLTAERLDGRAGASTRAMPPEQPDLTVRPARDRPRAQKRITRHLNPGESSGAGNKRVS
jgi:uncharacterized protein (UPF0548 family)